MTDQPSAVPGGRQAQEYDPLPIDAAIQREIARLNAESNLWETPSATEAALYAFARFVLARGQAALASASSVPPSGLVAEIRALSEKAEQLAQWHEKESFNSSMNEHYAAARALRAFKVDELDAILARWKP